MFSGRTPVEKKKTFIMTDPSLATLHCDVQAPSVYGIHDGHLVMSLMVIDLPFMRKRIPLWDSEKGKKVEGIAMPFFGPL